MPALGRFEGWSFVGVMMRNLPDFTVTVKRLCIGGIQSFNRAHERCRRAYKVAERLT
jgi:hypothetical protein